MVRPAASLERHLNELLSTFDFERQRQADPIRFSYGWSSGPDRDVVAVLSALLSYGRAELIGRAITDALSRMGDHPAEAAMADDERAARERFNGFVYRLTRGEDLARLWLGLGAVLRRHGTIGAALPRWDEGGADLRSVMTGLRGAVYEATPGFAYRRAFEHFFPAPARGSACKRLNMLLRWMVRGPDQIDFGDWSQLGPERLTMPLDTHIHRIARYLALTDRSQANWATAVEITDTLRAFDPRDPLKYDFALAHLGISGDCPTYRKPSICIGCPLNPVCQLPDAS